MKIACLVESLATFGGTQKQFLRIAEHLFLQGHQVELFTSKLNTECALGIDKIVKINVIDCSQRYKEDFAKEFLRQARTNLSHFDWLLVADGDLVYIKLYYPEAKVCWICNDAPYSHKAFVYGHGLKFRIKYFFKSLAYSLISHKEVTSLDKIIVLDSKMQKAIRKIYNVHAEIIRSGIDKVESGDNEIFAESILNKYNIKSGQYVLALGIAYPMRNYEVLIKCSTLINPMLKILISAPKHFDSVYFDRISVLASSHRNVHLNSEFISEDEKYTLLKNAAMFVFPNKNQTWGLAPLEAASVKTPIIVSNECGVTEVLEEGKTALIFNSNDHRELAKKINQLYSDTNLGNIIKENSYTLVTTELNWLNYTSNIIKYLKS